MLDDEIGPGDDDSSGGESDSDYDDAYKPADGKQQAKAKGGCTRDG